MKQKQLQNQELSSLFLELSLLLHAGIGLGNGIHLLADEDGSGHQKLLCQMADHIDQSEPLSGAMETVGVFPEHSVNLVKVGEKTGRLEESLSALSRYYEAQERLAYQIKNALLYPAVLLFLLLIVIAVLLMKVLPIFDDVFASLGGHLTGLAGGLFSFGQALNSALPLLCVIVAVFTALLTAFASSDTFRFFCLRRLYLRHQKGRLSSSIAAEEFSQVLAMGMRSGLPIEESLRLGITMQTENPAAQKRQKDCLSRLEQGANLSEALRLSGVLPSYCCKMLAIGLRSGSGDSVMEEIVHRLTESCENEIDKKIGRLEPTMVIVASFLVGVILLSVMLPLMNIMTSIG